MPTIPYQHKKKKKKKREPCPGAALPPYPELRQGKVALSP